MNELAKQLSACGVQHGAIDEGFNPFSLFISSAHAQTPASSCVVELSDGSKVYIVGYENCLDLLKQGLAAEFWLIVGNPFGSDEYDSYEAGSRAGMKEVLGETASFLTSPSQWKEAAGAFAQLAGELYADKDAFIKKYGNALYDTVRLDVLNYYDAILDGDYVEAGRAKGRVIGSLVIAVAGDKGLGKVAKLSPFTKIAETIEKVEKVVPDTKTFKSVDEILSGGKQLPKTGGPTTQFQKAGGFDQANADFDALELSNVKPIHLPNGGTGRAGTLPDGRKVTVRSNSSVKRAGSESQPTIDIFNLDKTITKIRY